MRIDSRDMTHKGVETYSCGRFREHGIAVASWIGTYGFHEMKHDDEFEDDVYRRDVPIL